MTSRNKPALVLMPPSAIGHEQPMQGVVMVQMQQQISEHSSWAVGGSVMLPAVGELSLHFHGTSRVDRKNKHGEIRETMKIMSI